VNLVHVENTNSFFMCGFSKILKHVFIKSSSNVEVQLLCEKVEQSCFLLLWVERKFSLNLFHILNISDKGLFDYLGS
jgi:hypothetical protein